MKVEKKIKEKVEFQPLLCSSDKNLFFSKLDVDDELASLAISQELLVSTPLDTQQLSPPKEKRKSRKPRVYKKFEDKYERSGEILGRGARSLVETVIDKKSKSEYAVKIVEKSDGYDRGAILREIDLLYIAKDHPNILKLYESFEEEHRFYLIFERMEGGQLLSHIQRKDHFTEKEASLVIKDVATALEFLHQKGIAHRDLKPENILCKYEEEIVPIKICDFNLASGLEEMNCITPELYTPVGSAEYMAPEVVDAFQGDAPAYDKRCDLWSLGVILFIMLSGKAPFFGNCGEDCEWEKGGSCYECQRTLWNSIKEGNFKFDDREWKHISPEAKDLVSNLLVKDASKRLTAKEVLRHPWVSKGATGNVLKTPNVLCTASTDNQFDPFSLMSTEVLAYNRILSKNSPRDEKQSFTDLINESSWPKAEFGLSPPGKSSLARRRAEVLKRKEENYKETKCAEQPMENPALTKQTFEKLSFPSYKVSEETSRIP